MNSLFFVNDHCQLNTKNEHQTTKNIERTLAPIRVGLPKLPDWHCMFASLSFGSVYKPVTNNVLISGIILVQDKNERVSFIFWICKIWDTRMRFSSRFSIVSTLNFKIFFPMFWSFWIFWGIISSWKPISAKDYPPKKLRWQWKIHHNLKMYFPLKMGIFQCHLRGKPMESTNSASTGIPSGAQ